MNEITQTKLNIIPAEDIEYLTKQSTAEIGKIVAGMTSLMRDTDARVEQLESQNWFQRMCKTVTGSNKASREVIQKNNAKLGAYMAQAVSILYDRQLIDEKLITNLGLQINMLYADQVQMKKQLGAFSGELNSKISNLQNLLEREIGAFAEKLNKKIESVDNFHLLVEEINLGHYTQFAPMLAICEVTALFDERILKEERKLNILREALEQQNIINDNKIEISDYLNSILEIPAENVGQIVMELGTVHEKSPLAEIMLTAAGKYHYLPDMVRKMKSKTAIIENLINDSELDKNFAVSTREIYDEFVSAKIEIFSTMMPIDCAESGENADKIIALADECYLNYEYIQSVELYREAAELGNVYAMLRLGDIYYHGERDWSFILFNRKNVVIIEKDYKEAAKWYTCAVENGCVDAINRMGRIYEEKGLAQNYEAAVSCYNNAAVNGNIEAMYNLARMIENGKGTAQDYKKAKELYLRAAIKGNADAMYNVGLMYHEGKGVPQDLEKAKMWYRKAVKNGNEEAEESLKELTDE